MIDIRNLLSRKRTNKVFGTLLLCYSSLGGIYGDIGTSPLYVFSGMFPDKAPNEENLLGGLSCIFWTFTLIVILKYCLIVLTFGPNHNEGGQIAIYSKIASKLKLREENNTISNTEDSYGMNDLSMDQDLLTLARTTTIDTSQSVFSDGFAKSVISVVSLTCALYGCSLVFSDGLLTPTTSVLSAISGIAVAKESFMNKVMPVSVAVLIVLFLIQRFGSGKLSILFSPIIFLWMITLLVDGIYWIAKKPEIMKALNPAYAFELLAREKNIDILSPVMLCVTGTEAMFADVSHFGALPIQITLICFVYPCLMCQYFGQAAYISINRDTFSSNLFYSSIPFGGIGSGYYWFVFILATLATVIASQALILGCFSILKQLIYLDCFPRLKLIHTSKTHKGRVFIPVACYVLMVAVVLTTVGFKTSNNVTAAYGLGISIDFVMTTILIAITLRYVYHYHWLFSLIFLVIFGSFEVCLVISGLRKIVHGAWFPLVVSVISFAFIIFWRMCRRASIEEETRRRKSVRDLFGTKKEDVRKKEQITLDLRGPQVYGDHYESDESSISIEAVGLKDTTAFNCNGERVNLPKIPKIYFIYCSSYSTIGNGQFLPSMLESIVKSFFSIPTVCVFIETRVSTLPEIPADHPLASVIPIDTAGYGLGFYRCIIRSGFLRQIKIKDKILNDILVQISEYEDNSSILSLPVLHIFESNLSISKRPKDLMYKSDDKEETAEEGMIKKVCRYCWKYPVLLVRKGLIDWIYSPMANGSMEYLFNENEIEDKKREFIYVGEKIGI
ncbi:hypothetical protein FOA43_000980 [Brettanomyces nanus]|uniref:K+ potassium transporter integral membrane domain-containing protein n=1 Tax=Eeniella nana TaxID=13502 RepID=A0A875RTN0_EENNA|nr:uncharacterized protein FOA43_000980 [Brettanomyces nanus]QPG73667.1 hypothetical protein FOA43_000980 [Brettanomyces nanus]